MHKHLHTLGLPDDAGWRDIRHRFRILSLLHHPDQGGDASRFIEIKAAYEALREVYGHESVGLVPYKPRVQRKPRPSKKWRRMLTWRRLVTAAALVGASLSAMRIDPLLASRTPSPRSHVNYAADPCPTGQPAIRVVHVSIEPAGGGQVSYTVGGSIFNASTSSVEINQLGFYIGGYSAQRPPDWLADPYQMAGGASLADMGPGQSVDFADTTTVPADRLSAQVTATAGFPRGYDLPVEHTWSWIGADPGCQPL